MSWKKPPFNCCLLCLEPKYLFSDCDLGWVPYHKREQYEKIWYWWGGFFGTILALFWNSFWSSSLSIWIVSQIVQRICSTSFLPFLNNRGLSKFIIVTFWALLITFRRFDKEKWHFSCLWQKESISKCELWVIFGNFHRIIVKHEFVLFKVCGQNDFKRARRSKKCSI